MLREILISLRTRCAPALVQLGYRYASVACVSRAARCALAWAPHQERTKLAILVALADVPAGADTAIILGSGPCLDLPVPDLLARFRRLVLVDVAHPPAARQLARRHPGIRLVDCDLTGVAAALADPATSTPPPPGCDAFLDEPGLGLVVSCNLISQLPLVPWRQVQKRWPAADAERYARSIVQAHLDHLRRFACPTLLIGDVWRHVIGPDRRMQKNEDPLFGATLPAAPDEWDWTVAPVGELSGGWSVVNRVRALRVDRLPPVTG